MQLIRRFVWWKGLVWAAMGCGFGAVVASHWPEVSAPAGAKRVTAERFVVTATGAPTATDGVSNVTLYPPHDGVQLITFDFRSTGVSTPAYTFGNTPFVTADRLRRIVEAGQKLSAATLRSPSLVYAMSLRSSADRAVADVSAQSSRSWSSATAFLDHVQTIRPGFAIITPWWTQPRWQYGLPMGAGTLFLGSIGLLLTRRSEADAVAAGLLSNVRSDAATQAEVDLTAVRELDALLESKLHEEAESAPAVSEIEPAPVANLATESLRSPIEIEAEEKSYAGEFYPTVRETKGFSLVELVVVIGVIALLIALLLPTLIGARRSADAIACAANLRSIGQGMGMYLQSNQNTYPAAYEYIGQKIVDGKQTPTHPSFGYVHWSSYLYSAGTVPESAFTCPALRLGGLPPTNTPPANRDPGQLCPSDTIVDFQSPRLAYTVNEALCPRNKFVAPSFGAERHYRFVKSTEVKNSAGTILATEMTDNAAAISYGVAGTGWIMSHRPISGFAGLDGELDMYLIPAGQGFRAVTRDDLDADPNTVGNNTRTRLDLVGRNHGKRGGYPDRRLTNFLYVDGHVETKSIYDTVHPFEWGERFYSLVDNDDQVTAGPS